MKKLIAILSIALPLASNVYADQIVSPGSGSLIYISKTSGSATKVCRDLPFLTSVSGTLVTNLQASNLVFVDGVHVSFAAPGKGRFVNSITVSDTLTATATPGVYTLCITPTNFTWTRGDSYEFTFLINGSTATDNGVLDLKLLD